MKKLICVLLLFALLLCVSCNRVITDAVPPLSQTDGPAGSADPKNTGTAHEPNDPATPDKSRVYLEISSDTFAVGDVIKYTYVNNTGLAVNILSIPRLEIETATGWEPVPFCDGVGFCGTPDSIAANSRSLEWELDTEMLYGSALESGRYRLSLSIVDVEYKPVDSIHADFEVV